MDKQQRENKGKIILTSDVHELQLLVEEKKNKEEEAY